jgi:hypothetical protein
LGLRPFYRIKKFQPKTNPQSAMLKTDMQKYDLQDWYGYAARKKVKKYDCKNSKNHAFSTPV